MPANSSNIPLDFVNSELIPKEIAELESQIQKRVAYLRQQRNKIIQEIINVGENQWSDDLRNEYKEALGKIAHDISLWMNTERTTIYFLNVDKDQLWSIFAQSNEGDGRSLEINLRVGDGIAGRVAQFGETRNIRYPARACEHSEEILRQDERNNFKTYTLLTIPVKNEEQEVFAVVQFVNRLREANEEPIDQHEEDYHKYSRQGFTPEDEQKFLNFISRSAIQGMLGNLQDWYNVVQQLKAGIKSTQAVELLSQSSEDLTEALQQIMKAAKKLMNADRSTLWILDHEGKNLWTQIPSNNGELHEVSIEVNNNSLAGSVASPDPNTKRYPTFNIPFDVYQHPLSQTARKFDQENNYRTCSLLCMPVVVYDEKSPGKQRLIGVTQLLNKLRDGFAPWSPSAGETYEKAPECFETSFSKDDERRMEAFNAQVSIVLQSTQGSVERESRFFLCELLDQVAYFVSCRLLSESATVYLFDERENKLLSVKKTCEGGQERVKTIEWPKGEGLVGKVADSQKDEFIHQKPESDRSKYDRSQLIFPLFNQQKDLLAVIEVCHKKKFINNPRKLVGKENDYHGFTHTEKEVFFTQHFNVLVELIQSCHTFYKALTVQRNTSKQREAQRTVLKAGRENYMEMAMKSARELVNADRCTLWRLDRKNKKLIADGYVDQEGLKDDLELLPVSVGSGYVGQAAQAVWEKESSSQTKLHFLKVDCDLYHHDEELSQTARKTDRKTGYRTCSLLCLPIFNNKRELLGILQLVNKLRSSVAPLDDYSSYSDTEEVPLCFDASFDEQDIRQLELFNQVLGGLIYEEETLAEVRRKINRD